MTTLEDYSVGHRSRGEAPHGNKALCSRQRPATEPRGSRAACEILDVGGRVGDDSPLAARIVGEKGSVLGVDRVGILA